VAFGDPDEVVEKNLWEGDQQMKPFVVPAVDEKGNVQYFLVEFSSAAAAEQRVENVVKGRPGWAVTGKALQPITTL
jgi:hypothetical protein